ncbi:MAG: D-glycero-alpha-D-manno-heptose-1,7-bisphosphate 7-phosphatase [Anaerolineae bacterium]
MAKPAIFLDRDGVIIENRDAYVRSWDDVEIFDDAVETVVKLKSTQYLIVIVTNQSAVGRKIITIEGATAINNRLVSIIEDRGGFVDGVYICPHSPIDNCNCRKPRPGMLLQAAEDLDIDLAESIMVGDALTDLEAGIQAGVKHTFLLETGRGLRQTTLPEFANYEQSLKSSNLTSAMNTLFMEILNCQDWKNA